QLSLQLMGRSALALKFDLRDTMRVDRTENNVSDLGPRIPRLAKTFGDLVEGAISNPLEDRVGQEPVLETMVQEFALGERRQMVRILPDDTKHALRDLAVSERLRTLLDRED